MRFNFIYSLVFILIVIISPSQLDSSPIASSHSQPEKGQVSTTKRYIALLKLPNDFESMNHELLANDLKSKIKQINVQSSASSECEKGNELNWMPKVAQVNWQDSFLVSFEASNEQVENLKKLTFKTKNVPNNTENDDNDAVGVEDMEEDFLFELIEEDLPVRIHDLKSKENPNLRKRRKYMNSFNDYDDINDKENMDSLEIEKEKSKIIKEKETDTYQNVTFNYEETSSWGLDRIDQRNSSLDSNYQYLNQSGANVTVYILDTGVKVDLDEFEGRASIGNKTSSVPDDQNDLNGHGTFVAGIIGGKNYGVAKSVNMISLKILDDEGAGTISDVARGLIWVLNQTNRTPYRNIINISAGSMKSRIMNRIVDYVARRGIIIVVAAGNESDDACDHSPSSARRAISVGATDNQDTFSNFSNYGQCVHLLAPGANVTSIDTEGNKTIESGTSFSSPYVAGAIAQFWSFWPLENHTFILNKFFDQTTKDVIQGMNNLMRTPNRFIFSLPF